MTEIQKKVKIDQNYEYTNDNNPFNDKELNKKFVWGKKNSERQISEDLKQQELEIVRKRRIQREIEKEKFQGFSFIKN